jgi:hypothetical protein
MKFQKELLILMAILIELPKLILTHMLLQSFRKECGLLRMMNGQLESFSTNS